MELARTTTEQHEKLKQFGFPINTTSKHPTPTLAFVLKWLRDEKNICAGINRDTGNKNTFYMQIVINGKINNQLTGIKNTLNSYEEAESAAIDYSLEYLLAQNHH